MRGLSERSKEYVEGYRDCLHSIEHSIDDAIKRGNLALIVNQLWAERMKLSYVQDEGGEMYE